MFISKAVGPGIALVGLGLFLSFPPACKAQEVSPDHFTDSGVEGVTVPTRAVPKTIAFKKDNVSQPVAKQARLSEPVARPRKAARDSRKKSATAASGK